MRIAVSGTHRVGKTTLAHEIVDALPGHDFVDEPYHDLAAGGHVFAHPPGVADFEYQLEHALETFGDDTDDVVFDRCPADLLAYLFVATGYDHEVVPQWGDRVCEAVRSLDALVFVPIEVPEVIEFTTEEDSTLSRDPVHDLLRSWVVEGGLDLGVPTLEVQGPVTHRVRVALDWLAGVRG